MLAWYSGVGERHDLQRPGRLQQAPAVRAQRNAEGGQGGILIVIQADRYLLWKGRLNAGLWQKFKSSHFQELSEDAEVLADAYGEILKNTHLKVFKVKNQDSKSYLTSTAKIVRLKVWSSDGKWPKISFKGQEHTIMMRL